MAPVVREAAVMGLVAPADRAERIGLPKVGEPLRASTVTSLSEPSPMPSTPSVQT